MMQMLPFGARIALSALLGGLLLAGCGEPAKSPENAPPAIPPNVQQELNSKMGGTGTTAPGTTAPR